MEAKTSLVEVTLGEYKSPEETLREITEFLKTGIEANRKKFTDPNDDWYPMYLVVLPDGKGALFTSTEDKHLFVNFVAGFAKNFGAVGIGQLNSSWRTMPKDGVVPQGSIAGKPGSVEGLLLATYTRTDWQVEWATIQRDGVNPPALAPWEMMMRRDKDVPLCVPLLLRENREQPRECLG